MAQTAKQTIIDVGYSSTHYWVISVGTSRLLLDLGYPGTLGKMQANLKRMGVPLGEIKYALATHYHIDHAGLAQELKQAGVPLLVLPPQLETIPIMKRWTKPQDNYVEITLQGNVNITFAESRAVLAKVGIAGEILSTPGHSDDSVSLLLDSGEVFTGDLTRLEGADQYGMLEITTASWRLLKQHGATQVYPGHGPLYPMYAEL